MMIIRNLEVESNGWTLVFTRVGEDRIGTITLHDIDELIVFMKRYICVTNIEILMTYKIKDIEDNFEYIKLKLT